MTNKNSVTPKAAAKHKLLFNEPALATETKVTYNSGSSYLGHLGEAHRHKRIHRLLIGPAHLPCFG